jgi:DNA repair exonuclease SbcCD ATPase subunit
MIPVSIEVTNFQSYEGTHYIDLDVIKNAVVVGASGSGKSSLIIDPIYFAFYGETRSSKEDLIHDNQDECRVKVDFLENKLLFSVIRELKRANNKQKLTLLQDNQNISERILGDTQEKLNGILGAPDSLLLSSCISPQDGIHLLTDLPPGEKERLFSKLLNFEPWFKKAEYVSKWLNDNASIESDRLSILTAIGYAKDNIDQLEVQIKESNWNISALNISKETLKVRLSESEEVASSQTDIATAVYLLESKAQTYRENLAHWKPVTEIQKSITDLQHQVELGEEFVLEAQVLCQEYNTYLEELQIQLGDERILWEKVETLYHNRDVLGKLEIVPCKETPLYSQCPLLTYSHEINDSVKKMAPGGIDQFIEIKTQLETKLSENEKRYKNITYKSEEQQRQLLSTSRQFKVLLNKLEAAKSDLDCAHQAQEKLNELETMLANKKALVIDHNIVIENKKLSEEYEEISRRLATHAANLVHYQKALEIRQMEVEDLKADLKQNDELYHKYTNYKTLQKVYKDVPSVLLNNILPQIESYANEILNDIFPGHQFVIRTHKETKKDTVIKVNDIMCAVKNRLRKFESLSGSEKFRFSLAFRLALGWVNSELYNVPMNFFIIDEGFGSLDEATVLEVKALLKTIADKFDKFLVITHVDELKDTFDTQIQVNKEGFTPRVSVTKIKSHIDVNIYD